MKQRETSSKKRILEVEQRARTAIGEINQFISGAALSNETPQALGTETPGLGIKASRDDHVHPGTLTTKGDLLTHTGSALARVAVGTKTGAFLTPDTNEANGVKWSNLWWPNLGRSYIYWGFTNITGATRGGFGINDPTATGSTASGNDATGTYVTYTSGATADNIAGWSASGGGNVDTARRYNPVISWTIKSGSSIAEVAYNVLYTDTGGWNVGDDVSGANTMGFVFNTDLGANWFAVSNSGSGASTFTDTGIAVATSTRYELQVECLSSGSAINYYINGAFVSQKSTDLPTTGTQLFLQCFARTLENAAKEFSINSIKIVQN